MSQKLKGQNPGLCMLFKSTGSDCPSLWEHLCFALLGNTYATHTALHSFWVHRASCFTEETEADSPSILSSAFSPALWACWLPLPGQTGCQSSAHKVMDPASTPFLLHIDSSPSLSRSFPPAYKTMWSHHLPSHRHTHTFILTLTCIPGFHSISVPFYGKTPLKWFISASRPHCHSLQDQKLLCFQIQG